MSDNETQTEQTAPEQPQGETETAIDWKAEARKWESRAKRDGEELSKLRGLDTQLTDANKRLAEAEKRAADAEKEAADLKEREQHRKDVETVAAEMQVPAHLIDHLGDMDAMRSHAEAIKTAFANKQFPVVQDSGEPRKQTVTKESILSIKNEKERLAAIREHPELFK